MVTWSMVQTAKRCLLRRAIAIEPREDGETTRSLSNLLIEQIEFADVLLISKADLATPEQLDRLRALLQQLNPRADGGNDGGRRRCCSPTILNTGKLRSLRSLVKSPGWAQKLDDDRRACPESDTYGVRSSVYRSRAPFHPDRLADFLETAVAKRHIAALQRLYVDRKPVPRRSVCCVQTGGAFDWAFTGRWWNFVARDARPRDTYRRERDSVEMGRRRWVIAGRRSFLSGRMSTPSGSKRRSTIAC